MAYKQTASINQKMEFGMKKVFILSFLAFSLSACSLFMPKTEMVSATCSEPDAILQINGQQFKGSAQARVPRDRNVAITCLKPGYFPAQKSIGYSMSGTGIADTVGLVMLLFPGIGLFSAGAWSLDETNVNIPMLSNGKP